MVHYHTHQHKIEPWVEENDMVVMNDGQATRMNPTNGCPSVPDVTFASPTLAPPASRAVISDSIGSDHIPILIAVQLKSPKPTLRHWKRPSFKKANWDLFQIEVVDLFFSEKASTSFKSTYARNNGINKIIQQAAKKTIPMGASGTRRPWWNPELDEATIQCSKLRKKAAKGDAERKVWLDQCELVRNMTRDTKHISWINCIHTLNARTKPSDA
ncbi:hypothetical protein ElyMa_000687500 [Elysia marginata]|uniref:Endonuclease/exonuclease/phosphatase domain-containing protein n=1 Tax=Elysia marginata TaxID=1093978 RepID=A0AAV4GH94_9GAST|nr:hypothetical protein ElyMa_000687500 [Elysia marginata]